MAAVLGFCVPILAALWWLMQMKMEDTTVAVLKIKSALAGSFQSTVIEEAIRLFDLIESHLPYSLSQVDRPNARPSAFDRLAQGLLRIDADDPDRQVYREVIECALSGMIITEVKRLLDVASSNSNVAADRLRNPTGLMFAFEEKTERALTFIATATSTATRKEKWLDRHKLWTFDCFLAATITAFASTPFFFFDQTWSYYACVTLLAVFVVFIIAGLMNLGLLHRCSKWLADTAKRYCIAQGSWESRCERLLW